MIKRPNRFFLILTSVWFIAFAALTSRLLFAWDQQRKIPHSALATVPFDQEAGNIALSLSEGHGYANLFRRDTGSTAWLAPVYPFLLFLIFRFFGGMTLASFFAAVLLNTIFSAAATFPLYAIARRAAGVPAAAASGWAWVFLPAGVLMPFEWIWDTSLSVLLAVSLVWLTLRIAESSKRSWWLAYGLLWALALLTNPALGICLPFLFLWAIARAGFRARGSWTTPVASFALILACCLPWTLRNYERFHRFIPIRSSLPFELWIGNNDIFDEHAVRGIERITRYQETRRYAQLGETDYLDEKLQLASSFIRQKSALFRKLTGKRIIATWFGTEHPYNDFKRADSVLVRAILLINLVLTLGALAGICFLLIRKHPLTVPLIAFPVLFPLIYYVTHTSLRYRHPVDPLLLLLAVYAVASVPRPGSARKFAS
jgi:4-amino-4-deoxy-L-arabinose transferase-like glycosyltransferase